MIINKTRLLTRLLIILCSLFILLFCSACKKQPEPIYTDDTKTDILKIYCTEDFVVFSLSTNVISEFEEQYSCKVVLLPIDTEMALLDRLIAEKNEPQADIAIGLKNIQLNRRTENEIFQSYEPTNIRNINDNSLFMDKTHLLMPIAYTYYAFLYDSDIVLEPPKTFGEFQSVIWKDKIIMKDPATSLTGHAMLLWSLSIYSDRGFRQFWTSIKPNILKVAENRNETYISLQTNEAPIILSNLTASAFFEETEGVGKYKTFIPNEGSLREIKYAGILQGATNIYLARHFMEFMLTPSFQSQIPTSLYMFPVTDVALPLSFASIQIPVIDLTDKLFSKRDYFHQKWIDQWKQLMADK